jgi:hypothetical protein
MFVSGASQNGYWLRSSIAEALKALSSHEPNYLAVSAEPQGYVFG